MAKQIEVMAFWLLLDSQLVEAISEVKVCIAMNKIELENSQILLTTEHCYLKAAVTGLVFRWLAYNILFSVFKDTVASPKQMFP